MIVFRIITFIIMMKSLYGFHFHSGSAVIQSISHYPNRLKLMKPVQLKSFSLTVTKEISNIVRIILYAPTNRKLIVFVHPLVALSAMFIFIRSKMSQNSWKISSNINRSMKKLYQRLLVFRLPPKKLDYKILNKPGKADIIELLTVKEVQPSTIEDIAASVLASKTIKDDIERKHLLIMETERLDAIAEASRLAIIETATASIIDDAAAVVTQARSSLLVAAKVEAEEKRQALLLEENSLAEGLLIQKSPTPYEHEVLISNPAINSVTDDAILIFSQEEECLRLEAAIQDLKVSEESQISNIPASLTATDSFVPITAEVEALPTDETDPFLPSMDIILENTAIKRMDDSATLPVVGMLLLAAPILYMIAQ
mmetsp:Transcript_12660/g.12300  ORF Transcript_12660/g.12300 Transcript_12660/m.12300 type:complete len:370 (-) Transcript_12660:443-1552(-)